MMGIWRRKKTFQLETLLMQGLVEEVDGLVVTLEAVMADEQVRKIEALKHHGLGRAGHMLCAKVLSVPTAFASYCSLEQQGVSQVNPTNPDNSMYTRQPHRLMLVIGVDLIHLFPHLLDSYRDSHGVVQLHHCLFSGRTVACGNRTHPLTPRNTRKILARLESTTGFFGTVYELIEPTPSKSDERCVTLLSAPSSCAPAVLADVSVARAAPLRLTPPAGHNFHPEEPLEPLDQARPFHGSDPVMSESEVSKTIVAENRKSIFHGKVTPALQAQMERGAAPKLVPRHRLNKDCQTCDKCPVCYKAAPWYMQHIATKAFASRVTKVPIEDVRPPIPSLGLHKHATHVCEVKNLEDPDRENLLVNFGAALHCHQALRQNFANLPSSARIECEERLSSGVP